jgi:phage anti-repressor protein
MNDLIKIEEKEGKQAVNARELHEFLESKQDFSTWIKNRIIKYGFIENVDFICFHKKMEANNAIMTEYYIDIDMAKELSMVENNPKGREARKYFIETEKRYKIALPLYIDRILSLESKIEKMNTFIEKYNNEIFLPKQEETKLKKNCKQIMKILQRMRNMGSSPMNEDVFFGYRPDFMTREEFKEAARVLENEGEIQLIIVEDSPVPSYRTGSWSLYKLDVNPYHGYDYK